MALSRGELTHRIARSGARDEHDTMAFLFNAMAEQLHQLVTSLDHERTDLQRGVEQLSDVLSRMAAADFEARAVRRLDGSPLDVLAFLVNATAEELGGLYAELTETNDRLERQAHATVNERLAATNTLAAGVGHELRNPLGVAAGNLEYLAERLPQAAGAAWDAELAQAVADSRVAVERAAKIAHELALLRPSLEPASHEVRLDDVVGPAIRMVRNVVEHLAMLRVHGDPDAVARVDESRLGQVVVNLVQNAALSMPKGRPAHENLVNVWAGVVSDSEVSIEVSDNGVGMSPQVRSRAFEAFFTTRPVGEGTGLGLAICQRLVHDQGGRIELSSEEGVGTTFRVLFPRAREQTGDPGAASGTVVDEALLARVSGLRVLLVDDEQLFHVVVEHMLGPGVDFTATTSGLEGLQLARSGRFDVVLSDLMLPDLDGKALYERLAAEGHSVVRRLAFITGGTFSAEYQQFLDAVDAPVLGKPFTRLQVLTTVAGLAARGVGPTP